MSTIVESPAAARVTSTVCGSEVLLSLRVRWDDSGWLEDLEPHELVMVPC
jgi:hypothetical protein